MILSKNVTVSIRSPAMILPKVFPFDHLVDSFARAWMTWPITYVKIKVWANWDDEELR